MKGGEKLSSELHRALAADTCHPIVQGVARRFGHRP
jgi:hypothetical protein